MIDKIRDYWSAQTKPAIGNLSRRGACRNPSITHAISKDSAREVNSEY